MWKPITKYLKFQCKLFAKMFNALISYFGEDNNFAKDRKIYCEKFTVDELSDLFRNIVYNRSSTFFIDYQENGENKRDLITVKDINTPYGKICGTGETLFEAIMDFDKNYRTMKSAKITFDNSIKDMRKVKDIQDKLFEWSYGSNRSYWTGYKCNTLGEVYRNNNGIMPMGDSMIN